MSDSDGIPAEHLQLANGEVVVTISDEQAGGVNQVDLERWALVVLETAVEEGVEAGAIDVLMVDVDTIAALNAEHMGEEGPTDVLSFPLDTSDDLELPGITPHLGDIVLCPQVAINQAPDHAGTVDAEFSLLLIHGVLHLLGHDHAEPSETAAMQARERHNLDRYGLAHPIS